MLRALDHFGLPVAVNLIVERQITNLDDKSRSGSPRDGSANNAAGRWPARNRNCLRQASRDTPFSPFGADALGGCDAGKDHGLDARTGECAAAGEDQAGKNRLIERLPLASGAAINIAGLGVQIPRKGWWGGRLPIDDARGEPRSDLFDNRESGAC